MTGIASLRPEFRVGLRSSPYLADHAFQDMVVLPGSFYVDLALSVERAHSQRIPGVVRNIVFNSPVILSAEDSVIKLETRDLGDGCVEYTFYEASAEPGGAQLSTRRYAARLEVDRYAATSGRAFSTEPITQPLTLIEGERFYETLRENGNQYGPSFRNVSSIWRVGDQAVARLRVPNRDLEGGRHCLHPALLDSVTQLLAPFISAQGRTFILRSIEKIEVADVEFPEELCGHAVLLPQADGDATTFVGDIRVFDASGKTYLELSRVAFTLLERTDAAEAKAATSLVVAANFTAEPLEDSLRFWGEHFGVGLGIEFAPYNQVFQQLLDAGSALRRNSGGVNVIALALEEWARRDRPALPDLGKEKAERCFGGRTRRVLPNGVEIVHLNRYETDYLYKEIFEDQCYLKHGIRLRDGDTVVDIGANIGMFSLFVMSRCADARILAFEPAPAVYELLKANCEAYGPGARAFNLGVSDRPKTERFTFYEKSSVFSGFHSDERVDREAIRAVVRNMLKGASVAGESVEDYVNELTADRLQRTTHECRLTSLSHIIREQQLDRIDLLKIDAEKSELDILKGIDEGDWAKIGQIVIEIHDPSGEAIERVRDLLAGKGYRCAVEQETLLERAGLYNLYATRREAGEVPATGARATLERNVQEFCGALRSFMNHATAPLVLSICPRTPAAGDAELKAALDDAEQALIAEAAGLSNVRVIGSALALQRYPLDDYYDSHAHRVGHVPYTPECYAAIGTAIFRAIYDLKKNPFKVIVLDCDNTLWKGVCGEDGPHGVEVTPPFRALQEFMLAQTKAGMVLCLCSKNNEKDALEVFERRTDMLLKREHLVSWRINWRAKSENIRSLAEELDLGLDSFIFVDDNPVECAEVRINCPEVLTLQLPRDTEAFSPFLDHVWAFDRAGSTAEDRNRTRMYQQNRERHRYREESLSLKDFVKGLQLRLDVSEVTESEIERVSQLTRRTNQFNLTTIRRSEAEIRSFLKRAGTRCLVVRAADRFGDYGLVGVLMYEVEANRYKVDTLLLSCRVLGRGVEHELVSRLARRALEERKALVELPFVPSAKNQPALEFLTSLGDADRDAAGGSWCFTAERLARLEYDPGEKAQAGSEAQAEAQTMPAALEVAGLSERLQRIGDDLRDIGRLAKAIEEHRLGSEPAPSAAAAPVGNALEVALAGIWRKVLGNPRIGIDDNFFEVGGTSLRAVQVVATIKRELGRTLSIVNVFECPTVRLLAARLSGSSAGAGAATAPATAAAARGRDRRYNTARKRVS